MAYASDCCALLHVDVLFRRGILRIARSVYRVQIDGTRRGECHDERRFDCGRRIDLRRWFRAGLIRCWLFLTVSLLSHSLLDSVTTGGMNYLFILISVFFCEPLSENSHLMKLNAGKIKCLINIHHSSVQRAGHPCSLIDR